ncbi:MAG: toxin-antitoxin system HicB family antitoxin [Pyramidobacter sp.]
MRIPSIFHQKTTEAAKRNKVSINQYVTQALSEDTSVDWALNHVRSSSSVNVSLGKNFSTAEKNTQRFLRLSQ